MDEEANVEEIFAELDRKLSFMFDTLADMPVFLRDNVLRAEAKFCLLVQLNG